MSAVIQVHEASVHTAQVEIKTLTVRGKQVTQSVFRQLLQEQLVSDDGEFLGNPWGMVNYHPDKCAENWEHLHIVWQKESALRRAYVEQPHSGQTIDQMDEANAWLLWRIAWDDWGSGNTYSDWYQWHLRGTYWDNDRTGMRIWVAVPDGSFSGGDVVQRTRAIGSLREKVPQDSRDERWERYNQAVEVEKARRDRHVARWAELQDLPHLFIAV